MSDQTAVYAPQVFIQNTEEDAKQIILMPEQGLTTDQRWELETEWLVPRLKFPPGIIIDYGCGIGRLAKALDCTVYGIDISPSMRNMAPAYVQKAEFAVTHPLFLQALVAHGFRAKGGYSIWCLQHCLDLDFDCQLLFDVLAPGSYFYTLNGPRRYIPCEINNGKDFTWVDDKKSIDGALHEVGFTFDHQEAPPTTLCQEGSMLTVWIR